METIFLHSAMNTNCGYEPSHCWYYKFNPPLSVKRIMQLQRKEVIVNIPVKFDKQKFLKISAEVVEALADSIARYLHVCREEYMSMPWEMSVEEKIMGKCTALSLTHNHICYHTGQLNYMMRIAKEHNLKFDINF